MSVARKPSFSLAIAIPALLMIARVATGGGDAFGGTVSDQDGKMVVVD